MSAKATDTITALQPRKATYLVQDHVSITGRVNVFFNIATHGSTFYGIPPHKEVFPGCIVEVSVKIVGIDEAYLPRKNPFTWANHVVEDRKYVRGIRAKAKRIAAALKSRKSRSR